jgi:tetratricopeptide (TPR) repeat protein
LPDSAEPNAPKGIPAAHALVLAGIALLTFVWFSASWAFDFTSWDDRIYIDQNPYIRVLSLARVGEIFGSFYFSNYHPLTVLSYALDYHVSGLEPWAYHVQSAAWHGGVVLLLGGILWNLGLRGPGVWLLLLFWALHPLRVESVVWVSGRKDVLSVFFYLAAFAVHISAQSAPERYFRRHFPAEALLLLLALFSKSMAVTYVAVVFAWDFFTAPGELRRRLPAYALFAVLAAVFSWLNIKAQSGAMEHVQQTPPGARIANMAYSVLYYIRATVVPFGLSPLHPRSHLPALLSWRVAAAAAVIAALASACWRNRRERPLVSAGIAFYAIALLPVSGIIPVGSAYVADRYSYLPTVGLVIAAAAGMEALKGAWRVPLVAALMLPSLWWNSMRYMDTFRGPEAVWLRANAVYPDHPMIRLYLLRHNPARTDVAMPLADIERILRVKGDIDAAQDVYALLAPEAVQSAPELLGPDAGAIATRLRAATRRGDTAEAARLAGQLAALPDILPRHRALGANALLRAGRIEEALRLAEAAPAPSIEMVPVLGQIANVLLSRGERDRAWPWIGQAMACNPAEPEVVRALGVYYSMGQQWAEGAASHERLLARHDLSPAARAIAWGMLGFFRDAQGQSAAAAAAYAEAMANGTRNPVTMRNFARHAAARGDIARAQRLAARAERIEAASAAAPPR